MCSQLICIKFFRASKLVMQQELLPFTDVVFKIKLWSYLECCVLFFFWVNNEKFCNLALNTYDNNNNYYYSIIIIIWDVNSNTGALMHWITEVMWLTDCKLKMHNHQGLVTEMFTATEGYVHVWDIFLAPAHHCCFMFHYSRLCSTSTQLARGA